MRYVGGTWRVGGILALSRAFGDAYLKGSGQFEGEADGGDGYSSGFGVIADPSVTVTQLSCENQLCSIAGPHCSCYICLQHSPVYQVCCTSYVQLAGICHCGNWPQIQKHGSATKSAGVFM